MILPLCLWDSTTFWPCSAPDANDICILPAGQRKQGNLPLHIFLVASARRFPAEHEKVQYLSGFNCNYTKKRDREKQAPSMPCPVALPGQILLWGLATVYLVSPCAQTGSSRKDPHYIQVSER